MKKLERWLIKVYLGLHVGKQFGRNKELLVLPISNIESYLLETLYYDTKLPEPYGIYCDIGLPPIPGVKRDFKVSNKIDILVYIQGETNIVTAITCEILGMIKFCLLIRGVSQNSKIMSFIRPEEFIINNSTIKFIW